MFSFPWPVRVLSPHLVHNYKLGLCDMFFFKTCAFSEHPLPPPPPCSSDTPDVETFFFFFQVGLLHKKEALRRNHSSAFLRLLQLNTTVRHTSASYTTALLKITIRDCGPKRFNHGGSFFDYGLTRKPQWNIVWSSHCVFNSHSNYRFVLCFFSLTWTNIYTREVFNFGNLLSRL